MAELDLALDRIKQLPDLIEVSGLDHAEKKAELYFMEKKKDATHGAIVAELCVLHPDYKENRLRRMADSQQVWVDFLIEMKTAKYDELASMARHVRLKSELDMLRTVISHETSKIRML